MSKLYVWECAPSWYSGSDVTTVVVCAVDIHEARKKIRSQVHTVESRFREDVIDLIKSRPSRVTKTGVYIDAY